MTATDSPSSNQHIARKTAHAILWNYVSFGLGKAVVLATTAILARLLTPGEFGLVAIATLAVTYLSVLKDLGLGGALIQRRDNIEEAANTVFTLNLLLGVLLTTIAILIAPLVAAYFREPEVTPILRWLALTFIVEALGSVHIVCLRRELAFNRKLIPDMGRSIVKGAVSIGCALAGMSAWALVSGQLAGVVTSVVLAWIVYRWRPRLHVDLGLARSLLKFGLSLIGVNGLAIVYDNLDYLIVGRALGNEQLGIYTLAYRLPELLVLNILWAMAAALFPAYAAIQDQPETLRRGFMTTVRYVGMISVPLCLGLFLAADPLVRVVFGERWLEAIPVVRVLSIFVLVRSVGYHVGDVYKAIGRPDILVKLAILDLSLLLPALLLGSRLGLVGIAWGHVVVSIMGTAVYLWVASRFMQVRLIDIFAELRPALAGGLVLVVLVVLAMSLTPNTSPLVSLLVAAAAGSVGYLGALWSVERDALLRAADIVGLPGLFRRRSPSFLAARSLDKK